MIKFKRIILLILSSSVLFLGSWVLIEEFYIRNLFTILKQDPTLLIPVFISMFSIFSVLFGIKKFLNTIEINSTTYKVLRIGDLVFSTSLFFLMIIGTYLLIENHE